MSEIHKPKAVQSGTFAFRRVEPSTVLEKGEKVFKHTSYPLTFLEKFDIPPFDHLKAKVVEGDGITPLREMHYSHKSPNAVFYRVDLPLTEAYREYLYKENKEQYVARDGNVYTPAPLDSLPDLAVSQTSGKEVISGDNRYGSRLVFKDRYAQTNSVTGWVYYLRRSRNVVFDEQLLSDAQATADAMAYDEGVEPESLAEQLANPGDHVEHLFRRLSDLEEKIDTIIAAVR